jgi:hypothetical protein
MNFIVYNVRMKQVGSVSADNAKSALEQAKSQHPGASVEKILTDQERRQKFYQDECDLWESMRRV